MTITGSLKTLKDSNGNYMFPITVSDAVIMEDQTTAKDTINSMKNSINLATYTIELTRWGITKGSFGKPPYTQSKWDTAYNNVVGIQNALSYANDNNYGRVLLPKGTYSVCFSNSNANASSTSWNDYYAGNKSIALFSNQIFDLGGSRLEVIYDSDNQNPYNKSTNGFNWMVQGDLFQIFNCQNTHITNGTIVGDIYNRSFNSANIQGDGSGDGYGKETWVTHTNGINIDKSSHCSVTKMKISGFMGDNIISGCYPDTYNTGNWQVSTDSVLYPGYENATVGQATNVTTAKSGAYISNSKTIDSKVHPFITMRTSGGFIRVPNFQFVQFEYIFYRANGTVTKRIWASYLQNVNVPFDATTFRIQAHNETAGQASINKYFAITDPQSHHILITECDIFDGHRGGISGGADFIFIEKNRIYNNGLDSGIGAPLYPDGTRYAIDVEDSYSRFVIIRDNDFWSGYNGVLLGAHNIIFTGNFMSDFSYGSAVVVYTNSNAFIHDNVFYNTFGVSFNSSNYDSTLPRMVTFSNNSIFGGYLGVPGFTTPSDNGSSRLRILDNRLIIDGFNINGEVDVQGNYFKSWSGPYMTDYPSATIKAKTCMNNIFEDYQITPTNNHLGVVLDKYDEASIIARNRFKNVRLNFSGNNDVELIDSYLYNCTILDTAPTLSQNRSLRFTNCRLNDSSIFTASSYVGNNNTGNPNVKGTYIFNNCRIKFSDSYVSTSNTLLNSQDGTRVVDYPAGSIPRLQEVYFYNCDFENTVTTQNSYVLRSGSSGTGDRDFPKKVTFRNCVLTVSDYTKFTPVADTANATLVVIDTDHNFSALTIGKFESYGRSQMYSGTTPPTSLTTKLGSHWFNTVITPKRPVVCNALGVKEVDTLTISTGATTAGNIRITLNGTSIDIAVASGDTAGVIGNKIRATKFDLMGWTVGGTSGTATVTFTKNTSGTNAPPSFTDVGTTGVTANFSVTSAGTSDTWVDYAGASV